MNSLQSLLIVLCLFIIQYSSCLNTITRIRSIGSLYKVTSNSAIYSSNENSQVEPSEAAVEKSSSGKGFGKPKVVEKVPESEPEVGTKTYDLQAKRGVPEYNIFIRPTNSTDIEWIPVGSMVCNTVVNIDITLILLGYYIIDYSPRPKSLQSCA